MSTATITRDGGVVEIRLDRPERRNALTTELLRELRAALAAAEDDSSCRALVMSGAGSVFCAGADLDEFGPEASDDDRIARVGLVSEVMERLMGLDRPTIAAVQGAAVGAGWGLALACDLCYADADATFTLPEVAKGFRIPSILVARLVQLAGPTRAARIALTGEKLTADEAAAAGCVARVCAPRTAGSEASALAERLAASPDSSIACVIEPLRAAAAASPFRTEETHS